MLWSAAPLTFVAGSRPVGQSPAKPELSSTVIDPPALGVPAGCVDEMAEPDEPPDADGDEDFDDEELPHALTSAAIENRQAAIAASLRKLMSSLVPCSLLRGAYSPALARQNRGQGATRRGC